ncbi:MAG: hypothetical protein IJR13_06415 [Bacteroidales bacterium]|nr:hypothetical protein [Bacteroidales bacterium]
MLKGLFSSKKLLLIYSALVCFCWDGTKKVFAVKRKNVSLQPQNEKELFEISTQKADVTQLVE